jgi:predicted  nucleic acid-binding Zn-ribbon protein
LLQFILTCLRIDKLEDTLFTMATPETLPAAGIDILFYGPGYKPEDFASRVKEKRIVQFADEAFMKRLQANEALKAKTKQTIADQEAQLTAKNAQMTEANAKADGVRDQVRKLSQTLAGLQEELAALHKKIGQTRERAKSLADQVDVLESRFKEFDEKFKSVRERLTVLTTGGHQEEVAARLSQELAEDLMKLNEELARLMRVKSVKDVGSYISKSTQQRILKQIEVRERYPATRAPVTRVIVADDGSNLAQNLKRSFVQALGAYFKLRDGALEATTISRLNSQLDPAVTEERLPKANLLLILSQDPGDSFMALRQLVNRIRRRLPASHPIVLAPFGDIAALDPKSGTRRNLLGIKDRCALVNLSIADYADPQVVVRLLHDKVPPQPAAPATAAAQRSSA